MVTTKTTYKCDFCDFEIERTTILDAPTSLSNNCCRGFCTYPSGWHATAIKIDGANRYKLLCFSCLEAIKLRAIELQ